MKFSERYGYTPVREAIQIESMDDSLRNSLWSLLTILCWNNVSPSPGISNPPRLKYNPAMKDLCQSLWFNLFKKPLDQLDDIWKPVYQQLREHFFACEWYEVYDFIEFIGNNYRDKGFQEKFKERCNDILEKEMSAYRFVGNKITKITDSHEIEEIEQAATTSADPVQTHIQRALASLSDRKTPDYRNSIKESISAVESMACEMLGEKGTLGKLLKKLGNEINLHPALQEAFSKLYGYTSDEGGIRHALTEVEKTDFSDAKFMLVTCSAFINFVKEKIET